MPDWKISWPMMIHAVPNCFQLFWAFPSSIATSPRSSCVKSHELLPGQVTAHWYDVHRGLWAECYWFCCESATTVSNLCVLPAGPVRQWEKQKARTAFRVLSSCKVTALECRGLMLTRIFWWPMGLHSKKELQTNCGLLDLLILSTVFINWLLAWGLRNLRLGLSNKEVAQIFNSLSANSFRIGGHASAIQLSVVWTLQLS